jgi:hypothetical protein
MCSSPVAGWPSATRSVGARGLEPLTSSASRKSTSATPSGGIPTILAIGTTTPDPSPGTRAPRRSSTDSPATAAPSTNSERSNLTGHSNTGHLSGSRSSCGRWGGAQAAALHRWLGAACGAGYVTAVLTVDAWVARPAPCDPRVGALTAGDHQRLLTGRLGGVTGSHLLPLRRRAELPARTGRLRPAARRRTGPADRCRRR